MPSQDPSVPASIKRHRSTLSVSAVIASTCILAFSAGAAARPSLPTTERVMAGFQEQASPGGVIPLTPLTGLTSLDATVTINVDGTVNGKPTQGDLTAILTSNDQYMSQIDVTGSLLGAVVAQVGGSAVSLFRPSKVSVYTVPEGTYAVVTGLLDLCVKPKDSTATAALDQLSPQSLMATLTNSDVARGTFVGDETLNGTPVKHYVIDGGAFLAAAQASSDPNLHLFGQSLRSATDADLYVAADGGYPVAYRGGYSGTFEPLTFDGDFTVQVDLTGINNNTPVTLPAACDKPISL